MAGLKNKTKPTTKSAKAFIETISHQQKQEDALVLLALFEKATKERPVIWSNSIIGFGKYQYTRKNDPGIRDWMKVGFSPRKQNIVVYLLSGFEGQEKLLEKLGKHKTSSSCLYINKLVDIDLAVLEELIKSAYSQKVFIGQC